MLNISILEVFPLHQILFPSGIMAAEWKEHHKSPNRCQKFREGSSIEDFVSANWCYREGMSVSVPTS